LDLEISPRFIPRVEYLGKNQTVVPDDLRLCFGTDYLVQQDNMEDCSLNEKSGDCDFHFVVSAFPAFVQRRPAEIFAELDFQPTRIWVGYGNRNGNRP